MQNTKKVNGQIRASKVIVIGLDGQQLGKMPTNIALSKAENQGYDLVEVSNNTEYPICKIMDWGKYQFDLRKQERKNKSKNKVHLKEIRLKTRIADHDLTTKCRRCMEFLSKGDKVKVSIQVNFRINNDTNNAQELMDSVTSVISEFGTPSNRPKLNGRFYDVTFTPIN